MALLALVMLTPGPLLFTIYKQLVEHNILDALVLFQSKKDLANMIASFAYTMLGFMATIITVLFVLTKTENYESYRRNGYLSIFFFGYYLTVATLLFTAFVSLYGYSPTNNVFAFNAMLMSFSNNLFQIFIITAVICNIARHSTD